MINIIVLSIIYVSLIISMNISDFKKLILEALKFTTGQIVRVIINEGGKRIAEDKLDNKEELVTRKDIINFTNGTCFVLYMCSIGYVSSLLFTRMNSQDFTKAITVSMFALGVVIVAPKRII